MILPDPDHVAPGPGQPQQHPVRTTAVVIFATLILLALTVPQALVNWTRNFDPNPLQETVLSFAQWVQTASRDLRLNAPYVHGRALFLKLTGKDEG
jgi:hypothetical protein